MSEFPKRVLWLSIVFVVGVLIGVLLISPMVMSRYEIHTYSVMIMKLDTWTGRTWIMVNGKWEERVNKK